MLSKAVKGGFNEPPFGPALLHYVACIQKDRLGLSSRLLFAIHDLADKAAIVCMRRSGTGTMRYANGDIFEGQWANDMKNGPGVYYYADGAVYEGVWQEDIAKCGCYRQATESEEQQPGALPALQLQNAQLVLADAEDSLPPVIYY
jgi:hypothetical protein